MTQRLWQRIGNLYKQTDEKVSGFMARYGIPILRISLAVVFIWFGLLKLIGVSPVNELIARTVYWVSPTWFVPLLGLWEMAIGVGLLLNLFLRVTLLLMFVQLAGTFLVPVMLPQVAFIGGNPLLLTVEGEFVVKNLVLLAAGLVIGGTVRRDGGMGGMVNG